MAIDEKESHAALLAEIEREDNNDDLELQESQSSKKLKQQHVWRMRKILLLVILFFNMMGFIKLTELSNSRRQSMVIELERTGAGCHHEQMEMTMMILNEEISDGSVGIDGDE
ncbi:hypothetical protein DASC09_011740 [Saccharomycopsis crataegensis]|uniref:Uncharacterized protein n=1 Tax=Saccharomycopsis crataegensis TaxID=43959 RepID=A0AAV5QGJ5_9ASCO|nr:hypothetical protein DASC09_011740 [Saccharomycopsis crataegensis]